MLGASERDAVDDGDDAVGDVRGVSLSLDSNNDEADEMEVVRGEGRGMEEDNERDRLKRAVRGVDDEDSTGNAGLGRAKAAAEDGVVRGVEET